MRQKNILSNIDEDADSVIFRRVNTGSCLYMVRVIPNTGPDFMLEEQFDNATDCNNFIKDLLFAYRLGMKMQARLTRNSLKRKA